MSTIYATLQNVYCIRKNRDFFMSALSTSFFFKKLLCVRGWFDGHNINVMILSFMIVTSIMSKWTSCLFQLWIRNWYLLRGTKMLFQWLVQDVISENLWYNSGSFGFFMIGLSDAFLSDYLTDLKLHSTKINFIKNCPQWGLNSQPPDH